MRRYGSSDSSQIRRPCRAGCLLQHARELVPRFLREHPASGVRRRVHDHDACSRRDRICNRIDVEREVRRVQRRRDGDQVGGEQHRVVAEPPGRRDDDFVAGVGQQCHRQRDRTECALSHRDVVRLEVESEFAAEAIGDGLLRRALVGLVRVPVDRSRFELRAHGVDEAGQSHLVRIAESEIQRVGILRERLHAREVCCHPVYGRLRPDRSLRHPHVDLLFPGSAQNPRLAGAHLPAPRLAARAERARGSHFQVAHRESMGAREECDRQTDRGHEETPSSRSAPRVSRPDGRHPAGHGRQAVQGAR